MVGHIRGTVRNSLTGNTLNNVKVTFFTGSTTYTNLTGYYYLEEPYGGSGLITFELSGYETYEDFVTAGPGIPDVELDVNLVPILQEYVNTSATITNVGIIDAPVGILSEFIKADTGESYGSTGESRIIPIGEAYHGSYTRDYSYFPSGVYNAKLTVFDALSGKELDSEIKLLAIVK